MLHKEQIIWPLTPPKNLSGGSATPEVLHDISNPWAT